MAAPPPASLPTGERLKMLAKTLQFSWFSGHFLLLCAVLRYVLSYLTFRSGSVAARTSYRLAFVFAAVTYGIVVYKAHFAHRPAAGRPPLPQLVSKLLLDENVQYLGMALVWLYARPIPLALLPFTIYSVFHVASYARSYLIPTISPPTRPPNSPPSTPPTNHPWADALSRFVKTYHDASMAVVATFELALLPRLVVSALTFSPGSWPLLAVYACFFRQRYDNSEFVRAAVARTTARVDLALAHQSTPGVVRRAWEVVKAVVVRAYVVLDLARVLPAPPVQKKTQ